LGSNRLTTDSSGEVKEKFKSLPSGQVMENGGVKYSFTGKELDKSGLYYFNARYYDSNLGRFTSVDPVEDNHAYAYVSNNPMNLVDPNGEDERTITFGMSAFTPFRVFGDVKIKGKHDILFAATSPIGINLFLRVNRHFDSGSGFYVEAGHFSSMRVPHDIRQEVRVDIDQTVSRSYGYSFGDASAHVEGGANYRGSGYPSSEGNIFRWGLTKDVDENMHLFMEGQLLQYTNRMRVPGTATIFGGASINYLGYGLSRDRSFSFDLPITVLTYNQELGMGVGFLGDLFNDHLSLGEEFVLRHRNSWAGAEIYDTEIPWGYKLPSNNVYRFNFIGVLRVGGFNLELKHDVSNGASSASLSTTFGF